MTDAPRLHRTLARVLRVDRTHIEVAVIGTNAGPELAVIWPRKSLPDPLRSKVEPNLRVHVMAALDTDDPTDMVLQDWEWDGRSAKKQMLAIRAMQSRLERTTK